MPYFKLARYAHFAADFDTAEKWYWKAAACLENRNLTQKEAHSLASVFSNLCSCLTMMHRYEEALAVLERSKTAFDRLSTRLATEAILYAALGEAAKTGEVLESIRIQAPAYLESTQAMTEQILKGTHAHFSVFPVEHDKIDSFWAWFAAGQVTEESFNEELSKVFPYMQRPLQAKRYENKIVFRDFYVKALMEGYRVLIASAPDGVRFEVLH